MGLPAVRRATYEDVLAAPEHLVAEVMGGVLYTHPRPAGRHALTASALGGELFRPFGRGRGGPGGWWVLDEPELHLGHDIVVPDLAGWRRERLPVFPDTAFFDLAPDWACEVLSPSTARLDRVRKLPIYARERVGHLWLIEPLARILEVFVLDGATYRQRGVHADEAVVRAAPFDAIELELTALWPAELGDA